MGLLRLLLELEVLLPAWLLVELGIPILRGRPRFPMSRWLLRRLLSLIPSRTPADALVAGALEKKLAAWVDVNKAYAEALGQQRLVPEVVMAGNGGAMPNSSSLVELLTASTARQLALSMQVPGTPAPRQSPSSQKK
jgi:hypothetical protein